MDKTRFPLMFHRFSVFLFVFYSSFIVVHNYLDIGNHTDYQYVQDKIEKNDRQYLNNKSVPALIRDEVSEVLSYFPELADVKIDFVFKEKINHSFMQAQPKWYGFFQSKNKRDYIIKISRNFQMEGSSIPIEEMPKDVLIGWFAHELGHIMDYQERSAFSLMKFGLSYITSHQYMMEAERTADVKAIHCNLGKYLVTKKNFILNHADVPLKYKEKIKRFYMSAEEATKLMDNLPDDTFTAG